MVLRGTAIEIRFLDEDVHARAALLASRAPVTCAAIWAQLERPLELVATHAMWTGPEISLQVPASAAIPELERIPPENQTVFPQAGDLLWAFLPPYAAGGQPDPLYDIGIFYAPQGRVFLPMGWVPCNHFARLEGEWRAFQEVCRRTRSEGSKRLRLSRVK